MSKAVLIQHGVGHCAQMVRSAAPFHARYCTYHKIEYAPDFSQRRRIGEELFMEKIYLVCEWLSKLADWDLLIWLDADALIVNPLQDIRAGLPEGYDFAALRHEPNEDIPNDGLDANGKTTFNSGVIIVRVGPAIREIFQRAKVEGGVTYRYVKHDEGRLNALVDEYVAAGEGFKFYELGVEWNRWRDNRGKKSEKPRVIQAWHGEAPQRVITQMQNEVRKAEGALDAIK